MRSTVDTNRYTPNVEANHRSVETGAWAALPQHGNTVAGGRHPRRPCSASHCGQRGTVVQSSLSGSVTRNAPAVMGSPHSSPLPAIPAVHSVGRGR
jgi:hypothetical protein